MQKVYHGPIVKRDTYIILHNIRSAHNVGSILRTADGAGVTKVFLTGYTPTPIDRFGRRVPEIEKTSLGAMDTVPWEYKEDIFELMQDLRGQKIKIVAVEQTDQAVVYTDVHIAESCAFIFGNEIDGVPLEVCEKADAVVEIPMAGTKESLNVSVAAGIILFYDFA